MEWVKDVAPMEIECAKTSTEQVESNCKLVFSDERLKGLRAQGLTIPAIAKLLGVSRGATSALGRTSRLLSTKRSTTDSF